MRLLFEQRLFSWFDSYDIYDAEGNPLFVVKGELSLGHRLNIFDAQGDFLGRVQEEILTLLPRFDMYMGDRLIGSLQKRFSLITPKYDLDFRGWYVEGNFVEWDYKIYDRSGAMVATITKEILNITDTYVIDVNNPVDAIYALMVVLAIDAEKCSRN